MKKQLEILESWAGGAMSIEAYEYLNTYFPNVKNKSLRPFLIRALELITMQQFNYLGKDLEVIINHCETSELKALIFALMLDARDQMMDVVFNIDHKEAESPIKLTLSAYGENKLEIQLGQPEQDFKLIFSSKQYPNFNVNLSISINASEDFICIPCDDPCFMPSYSLSVSDNKINDNAIYCAEMIMTLLLKKFNEHTREVPTRSEELN